MAGKYSLKLNYLMSDNFDFFYSLFHIRYSKAGSCYLFGVNNNQIFISQILTVISPLEQKFHFSIHWDLNQKVHSVIKPAKLSHIQSFKTLPEQKEPDLLSRNCMDF